MDEPPLAVRASRPHKHSLRAYWVELARKEAHWLGHQIMRRGGQWLSGPGVRMRGVLRCGDCQEIGVIDSWDGGHAFYGPLFRAHCPGQGVHRLPAGSLRIPQEASAAGRDTV